jgi:uncharacterized protein
MSRIIFWLALIFLVIFAIRSKIREAQKRHQQQFRQQRRRSRSAVAAGARPRAGGQRRRGDAAMRALRHLLSCLGNGAGQRP